MRKFLFILVLSLSCLSVRAQSDFVRGADISWCTEMEADGRTFYNSSGAQRDIFALMKEIGMTAIRLRVWVNPAQFGYGAWCDKADVLNKARRAHAQGLDLMIDFHYSDFFADPGTQTIPVNWQGYTTEQLKTAVASHTREVLQALKTEGISPKWVQVGNETNCGMLFPNGAIDFEQYGTDRFSAYVSLSNTGYDAVKEVFPQAQVIVHLGGTENAQWFFSDFIAAGGKVDMIGLSHYPTASEWNSPASGATHSNINAAQYVQDATQQFGLPVMICETGFDVSRPTLAKQVMQDLFDRLTVIPRSAGIFYWEPETDGYWKPAYYTTVGWNAYGIGAFTTTGKPTIALEPFGAQAEATELVEQVDMSSSLLTSPAYTILGQPAPNGYKGIVIQNGKKMIQR